MNESKDQTLSEELGELGKEETPSKETQKEKVEDKKKEEGVETPEVDDKELVSIIEKFEHYKANLSGECLLIVEQLRLIAFTALDIQLLLQQVNFKHTQTN